jgi:membrane protease YdiL (CAAX protease family)
LIPRLAAPFELLLILPALGPALAALLTRRLERSERADFRGLDLQPRLRARIGWYCAAVAVPAIILLSAYASSATLPLTSESLMPRSGSELLALVAISISANPCEEIGWRGFALPRLQARYGPVTASLIIGLLSALWHAPLLLSAPMAAYPLLPWTIGTVCIAFCATWLYNGTQRSLWVLALFHVALNTLSAWIGITSFYVYALITFLVTAVLVVRSPKFRRGAIPP